MTFLETSSIDYGRQENHDDDGDEVDDGDDIDDHTDDNDNDDDTIHRCHWVCDDDDDVGVDDHADDTIYRCRLVRKGQEVSEVAEASFETVCWKADCWISYF